VKAVFYSKHYEDFVTIIGFQTNGISADSSNYCCCYSFCCKCHNNKCTTTAATTITEATQGYGILAQLCPEQEGEQQQETLNNVTSSSSSCQQQLAQDQEVIHIIRHPNMSARIPIDFSELNNTVPDSVLEYVIQKLQEVGYRDINVGNSTDTRISLGYVNKTQAAQLGAPDATIPARLVEITYATNSAPSEIRRGYFLLAATNVTPPTLATITGYSIFYEGVSAAASEEEETTTPSGSSAPLPAAISQVFDSFQLIPSEEVSGDILIDLLEQRFGNQMDGEEEEEELEDEGDEDE
jgi:hypothetical protein